MKVDTDIVIVGSGVGGATLAKELASKGKKVLIVEKGNFFPKNRIGTTLRAVRFYDKWGVWSRSKQGVFYYRTIMVGGTSVISCGSGVRSLEKELKDLGIDLEKEFLEVERELDIKLVPDNFIGRGTLEIREAAKKCGVDMLPMPKFINFKKCISCGRCVLGCRTEAKWTALDYLKKAEEKGASLITGTNIIKVKISGKKAVGVEGYNERKEKIDIFANKVVLAAGGLGTPVILQNSGIEAGKKLFLDLFNVTIGLTKDKDIGLAKEIPMAVVGYNKDFILSPFLDCALALAFVLPPKHLFRIVQRKGVVKVMQRKQMLGIMVKINDDSQGGVSKDGFLEKTITSEDSLKLKKGVSIAEEILIRAGVKPKTIITTKVRGAHPGGTAAIGEVVNKKLETRIKNLFVCDASVLPQAPGLPPIVTLIALAKRFSKKLKI